MPAILAFTPTDDKRGSIRLNTDYIVSYSEDNEGTALVVRGVNEPIVVKESPLIVDAILAYAGYLPISKNTVEDNAEATAM